MTFYSEQFVTRIYEFQWQGNAINAEVNLQLSGDTGQSYFTVRRGTVRLASPLCSTTRFGTAWLCSL